MAWQDELGASQGRDEPVELVGTHLRLTGIVSLGRFNRVTDMINASSGYLRIRDARLLRRNGDPTTLVLPELMVDQDEISYIAQTHPVPPEPGTGAVFSETGYGAAAEIRKPREFVLFTPGHTVTGRVHVFGGSDIATFLDSIDPRFVPVTQVTTRSSADRRISSRYDFLLINRTQLIAASEVGRLGDIAPEDVPNL